jgi:hypothetical protein
MENSPPEIQTMPSGGFPGGGILFSTVAAKVPAGGGVVDEATVSEALAPIDDLKFQANKTAAISTITVAMLQLQRLGDATWFMLRVACFLREVA